MEQIKLLELEVTQYKVKSIDLEEECQQLKRVNGELKKDKHMLQLE